MILRKEEAMKLEMQERLAANLRSLRHTANLSQCELARLLGIDRSLYALYESGRRCPDVEVLYAAAKFYGVRLEVLLDCSPENIAGEAVFERVCEDGDIKLLTLFRRMSPFSRGRIMEKAEDLAAWDASTAERRKAFQNSAPR